MSTPEKFNPADWLIVYDGIEYALPMPMTPREDMAVRRIAGESVVSLSRLGVSGLSALLIIAMQRAHGAGATINEDAILDDREFMNKFEFRQIGAEVVDSVPPVVAVAGDATQPPTTPVTPDLSGGQS